MYARDVWSVKSITFKKLLSATFSFSNYFIVGGVGTFFYCKAEVIIRNPLINIIMKEDNCETLTINK